jgi:hypothetical protein
MLLTAEQHGEMVFTILYNDFHRPFVKGKSNRDKIEENITIGIYSGEIPPCTQQDVDMVIALVDDLVENGIE